MGDGLVRELLRCSRSSVFLYAYMGLKRSVKEVAITICLASREAVYEIEAL